MQKVDITDLFCGAGGFSTGAIKAGAEVRLAINHWEMAIRTHAANHPGVDHHRADISLSDPRYYPRTVGLIGGPSCTNHTIAKGVSRKIQYQPDLFGNHVVDPAAERSRATMWDIPRFAEVHHYEFIVVENVVDAAEWVMWRAWLLAMDCLGYDYKVVYFNSRFAGVAQSRDRMYTIFWRKGNKAPDLEFPQAGYCPKCEKKVMARQMWKKQQAGRYGKQYRYGCPHCDTEVKPQTPAAATIIDWTLPIVPIGERAKHGLRPLKPKTLARIAEGLAKYNAIVLDTAFGTGRRTWTVEEPAPTQTTRQTLAVAVRPFIAELHGSSTTRGIDAPLATVSTSGAHHALCVPWVLQYYGTGGDSAASEALPTITTRERHALVQPTSADINECGFRMLEPHELQAAMAFAKDYTVYGTKKEVVKQLGNAVTPPVPAMLLPRILATLN